MKFKNNDPTKRTHIKREYKKPFVYRRLHNLLERIKEECREEADSFMRKQEGREIICCGVTTEILFDDVEHTFYGYLILSGYVIPFEARTIFLLKREMKKRIEQYKKYTLPNK